MRTRVNGEQGLHAFLHRSLNVLSAHRRVGGLVRLSHLPMVSENDKARKIRKKKGKNDIIYSKLRVNVSAKQFRHFGLQSVIKILGFIPVRKEGCHLRNTDKLYVSSMRK